MNLNDYVTSLVRTWVPIIVGTVASVLIDFGVDIDSGQAQAALTGFVIAVYYAVVRWAEGKYPAIGILLGRKSAPAYNADA